jgi:3-hydroxy-3-methylglutaryl CoA synthase
VITADQSLNAIDKPWEFVGGAAGMAMLISDKPDFIVLEQEKFGIYSHEVSDVIRPLPWIETGNSEHSLFSYMEALGESYLNYVDNTGVDDFDRYFDYNVYHVPFSGISYRAHKLLMRQFNEISNEEIIKSFNLKTKPSIEDTCKIGASYGGSVYIALLSLIRNAADISQRKRIGIFSYGSGSCAEYFSVMVGANAQQIAQNSNMEHLLNQRHQVSVEEYELIENQRVEMSKSENYMPDINLIPNAFESQYEGQNKLIFIGSKNYYRNYEFS